ncbi:NUDIX domain-containing protein [Pengzhenrongella sp.]|jgi:ADP-ribose pyrophosphatase YjhB (NUDIX family)|uniref:NUDIX hydrolase n=1 Tax=Pengzhenrongella sp. TaxID=2888820 RepID=UPI002F940B83
MPIPDFVVQLRSQVGTDLLWMPGVSAVVVQEDGRLLLGRRSDNGLWSVISGILEPGEQPAHAIVREILEETGIEACVDALVAVASQPEPIVYGNGDRAQYLDLMFLCRAVGGEAHVADDESIDVGWFPADDLPEPISDVDRARIAQAMAYRADPTRGTWFDRP